MRRSTTSSRPADRPPRPTRHGLRHLRVAGSRRSAARAPTADSPQALMTGGLGHAHLSGTDSGTAPAATSPSPRVAAVSTRTLRCAVRSARRSERALTTLPFVSTTQLCNCHIAVGQHLQPLRCARRQPSGGEVDEAKLVLYADRLERLSSTNQRNGVDDIAWDSRCVPR